MTSKPKARLPVPPVVVQPEMDGFWSSMRAGTLLLPQCRDCGWVIWPPRPYCPSCASLEVEWEPSALQGEVYSYTVNRRAHSYAGTYQSAGTYVLAYVELDEGPRVMTNIVDIDPDEVQIGMRVRGVFDREGDGVLLRFAPDSSQDSARPPVAEG